MDALDHSTVAYDNCSKIDKNQGLVSKIYKFLYILCSTSPEKLVQKAYRVFTEELKTKVFTGDKGQYACMCA